MDNWILSLLVVTAVLATPNQAQAPESLEATFSMLGVRGTATFTKTNDVPEVTFNMTEALGQTTIVVRPFWVNHDVSDKCSSAQLGNVADSYSVEENIVAGSTSIVWQSSTSLEFFEGQSLVLSYSNKIICATIQRKDADFRTAVVRFRSPAIFGHVYLRQAVATGSVTRIVADLNTDTSTQYGNWKISDSYRSCEDYMSHVLSNVYSPISEGADCSQNNKGACVIGDLSAKHGQVGFSGRSAYTDPNLPLGGDHSIVGLLMIIHPNDKKLTPACGVVTLYKTRSAVATFSDSGVKGTISFVQSSPFDPTQTQIDLQGLQGQAGGYHVHLWPVPERLTRTSGSMCAPEHVSGHFNPFKAVVGVPGDGSYPAPTLSTEDLYEVGDLSGKYGLLNGDLGKVDSYTDMNLQLFGQNSIVGRSLVIHRNDATKSRWVCATIMPQFDVVAAQAVFTGPVIGHVTFVQAVDAPGFDTSVFAKLDYLDGRASSQDHPWMVSSSALPSDMPTAKLADHCRSATSMYNPEGMLAGSPVEQYAQTCEQTEGQVACKTGDLAGKLGRLSIRNSAYSKDKSTKMFATDTNVYLKGPKSIVGRTLVIKTPEGETMACATIMPAHPTYLVARFPTESAIGTLTFYQPFGVWARPTTVTSTVNTRDESVRRFKIEIDELPPRDETCLDTGNIYDPLDVGSDEPLYTTDDQYKVGDQFVARPSTDWKSTNLPLTGLNSIKGRSLVVEDTSTTIRACVKIEFDSRSSAWTNVKAVATFSGDVTGTISLDQHVHRDGAMSDTTILLDVGYSNSTKTLQHNWHSHQKLVMGDSDASTGRCSSTGGHYNPFGAVVKSSVYKAECSPVHPLHCELGDQARKTHPVDLGEGRMLVTDVYLPLVGRFTVQGRSIVIHAQDKGAPRIACADIIPNPPASNGWVEHIRFKTPSEFAGRSFSDIASRVASTYADTIRANEGEIVVITESSSQEETKVVVYFAGTRSKLLHTRFVSFLNNDRRTFTNFNPINSAGVTELSVFIGLLSLIFSVILSR